MKRRRRTEENKPIEDHPEPPRVAPNQPEPEPDDPDPDPDPEPEIEPDPEPEPEIEAEPDPEPEIDPEPEPEIELPKPRGLPQPKALSKAKLKKHQMKEEKARIREAMLSAKKAREAQEDKEIAERKRQRQKEEEKLRQEDEEFEKLRKERKRKELEEYELLKQNFEVEESGSYVDEKSAFDSQIESFIEYIKKSKVIYIEDLAIKYSMQPKDLVEKIELLEKEKKLSGIFDERGKFIFITETEMGNLAAYINKRGRVNISDIARESNKLINLVPQVVGETEEEELDKN